jgi:hypothetical protein
VRGSKIHPQDLKILGVAVKKKLSPGRPVTCASLVFITFGCA